MLATHFSDTTPQYWDAFPKKLTIEKKVEQPEITTEKKELREKKNMVELKYIRRMILITVLFVVILKIFQNNNAAWRHRSDRGVQYFYYRGRLLRCRCELQFY